MKLPVCVFAIERSTTGAAFTVVESEEELLPVLVSPAAETVAVLVTLGTAAGVPTPLTARLVALIHEIERGARPQSPATLDALAAAFSYTVAP